MGKTCAALLALILPLVTACEQNDRDHDHDKHGTVGQHKDEHEHEHEHPHDHDWAEEVEVRVADFRMTVLGDSVAVGFLGDTQMGTELPAANKFFAALLGGDPQHPRAFDAYYKDNFKNAFSSGKNCVSLACRIEHNSFHVHNLAVSGARMTAQRDGDLPAQLALVNKDTTHYVLEAGTNDFCALDFDQDKLVNAFKNLSSKLLAHRADAQLLIVPVLPVVRVFRDAARTTDTAFTKDGVAYTCNQIRDGGLLPPEHQQAASHCPRLHGVTEAAQFDALQAELDAVNAALAALASDQEKVTHASPVTDTEQAHESRITFAASIAEQIITKEHLAADCFHPSRAGLELISAKIFEHVRANWKPYRVTVKNTPHKPPLDEVVTN